MFGGKSSSTSVDQRSDQSENEGLAIGPGNVNPGLADDQGTAITGSNISGGLTITHSTTDQGALEAGVELATEALRSGEDAFKTLAVTLEGITSQAIENAGARAEGSQVLASQALESAEKTQINLSDSLDEFGGNLAKANRSDGRELLEKIAPAFKWGALALVGGLLLKRFKK